ncbi:MAG TPA: hypothetical protein VFE37_04020, partial [Chloroflexota bacterium]|nr:hypothetical protein [Chloroflexota bacterium]
TRYGFDNFRLEAHFSVINGDIVRFHSYSLQARGCDPADPTWHGTIQTGGWLDYGQLHIDSPGYPDTIVPLVGVLGQPFPDPNPVVDSSLRRLHGTPDHPRPDATWYGRQGCFDRTCAPGNRAVSFNTGLRAEDWGAFDPANPATIIFYGGEENHSWHEPGHVLDLNVPLDLAVNGRVTYSGFTDRWGNLVPGCTAVGPDCIPLIINNMKPGEYQFRNDAMGLGQRDYDVKSPVTGKSLIQFPN